MVDVKISELSDATGLNGTDVFEIDTGSASNKVSFSVLKTDVRTGLLLSSDNHDPPAGGSTGQVLTKTSATNYDFSWQTPSGGGGGISDAPDSNNYVRTSGSWVNVSTLSFTPSSHTQALNTISDVTATSAEVNYLSGVTSSVQTQLNGKANSGGYTPNSVLITNGSGTVIASSTVDTTELGYLDGVTSGIQAQFTGKVNTTRQVNTTAPLGGGGALTGNLTLTWNSTNDVSIRGYRTLATVNATVTLGVTHQNSFLYCTNGAAATLTIPANATTAFAIGTEMDIYRSTAFSVAVIGAAGVTLLGFDGTNQITTTATLSTINTYLRIKKVLTNTWVVLDGRFVAS